MPLTSGTKVGQYEIIAPLGAGGMGEVYRARDSRLNRDVAIKVLPAQLAQDPAALARFEREAQAVAALSHPNILAIYDVGNDAGTVFAVTELLDGQTLRTRLADGALPGRKAIDFAVHIVRGIAAAHERGIVHRDLKPENIFITKDGVVKILDFGLAKWSPGPSDPGSKDPGLQETKFADTTPGMVLGTVGYMSPEQVRGLAVDHRSDIFSFGAVFYEMLTGQRPFRGDSHVETMNAILKEDPPEFSGINANLPGAFERIIRRCLEKQPGDRFYSAHDLGIALEAVSGATNQSSASMAAIPGAGDASRQSSKRPSFVVAAAAVLVASAIAFFAGRGFSVSEPPSSPEIDRLTYRRGPIFAGRMTLDGKTFLYSAAWEGAPRQTYSVRSDSPESQPLQLANANIVSISSKGELAVIRDRTNWTFSARGILARAPMSGAAMRDVLEDVQDADWLPNGDELAVARVVNGKYQIEFPIGKVVYQTDGWTSHIRVSPDGQRIAFLDQPAAGDDRGTAAIIDASGKKTSMDVDCNSTQGIAWAPSGQEVWFTCANTGAGRALLAGSLDGRVRTVYRVPSALYLLDIGADGSVLLAQENTRFGIRGLAPGETRERDLSWLDWGLPSQLSDDGRTVLFTEQAEGGGPGYSVFIRDTNGAPAVRLGTGAASAISPDGKWVIARDVSTSPVQLVLMPTGAGQPRKLTGDDIEHANIRFLRDDKHFIFNGFKPGRPLSVWKQALDGGEAVPVLPEGIRAGGEVSPDGTRVVGRSPDGVRMIYRIDQKDASPEPIRGLVAGDLFLRFSADNRELILYRKDPATGGADLFRLDLASGARSKMYAIVPPSETVSLGGVGSLFVSADGTAYVYACAIAQSDLFLVKGLK